MRRYPLRIGVLWREHRHPASTRLVLFVYEIWPPPWQRLSQHRFPRPDLFPWKNWPKEWEVDLDGQCVKGPRFEPSQQNIFRYRFVVGCHLTNLDECNSPVPGRRICSFQQTVGGVHPGSPMFRDHTQTSDSDKRTGQDVDAMGGMTFVGIVAPRLIVWGPDGVKVSPTGEQDGSHRVGPEVTATIMAFDQVSIPAVCECHGSSQGNLLRCVCAVHDHGFRINLPSQPADIPQSRPPESRRDTCSASSAPPLLRCCHFWRRLQKLLPFENNPSRCPSSPPGRQERLPPVPPEGATVEFFHSRAFEEALEQYRARRKHQRAEVERG